MAYNNDQSEQPLPAGDDGRKRKSSSHLPRYFRTQPNKKFLNSTLDQLIQPGVVEKLNAYVGRETAKAYKSTDNYVSDVSTDRINYQLEPASVIKDNLGNVSFYKDYNDYVNQLNIFNKGTADHSIFNQQEYYAWDPHVDWDKLTNFREYYWLPNGPQSFGVPGNTIDVESTYTVRIGDNVDNETYIFSPDGLTNNPTITLYRGMTYKFDIDTPNLPFTIKTKKTLESGFDLDSSSILVLEGVSVQGLEKGVSTLQLGTDTPDILYYMASNDLQASGTIVVKDITEATFIDVEKEILGKKTYKASNGVNLSNGMKVYFTGQVQPTTYAEGAFYIEGVGDKIRLIPEVDLNVPTEFTDDIDIAFDANGFDRMPFGKAIGYPKEKDYIVINRSATDGNLWSRYNRWYHKSVIETSAAQNNEPVEIDQLQRAKRPIIEFEADLKLHNFGTKSKQDVDLVDDYTTDVFSTIEGSVGYNVDGIDIVKGMRILFTADPDILVKGRIFEVDIIKFANGGSTNSQISLKEVTDSIPQTNEVVLSLGGTSYKGKMLYYANNKWNVTQEKSSRNQAPLFDIFDSLGNSYADTTTYEASTFSGTKLFSYKPGTGTNDTELGIPISYRSISNVGDIVFNYDISQDSMTHTVDNDIITKGTDIGFLRKYSSLTSFTSVTGWKKVPTKSEQVVIRQYTFDNTTAGFKIDVYEQSGLLTDLWTRVYLNNKLQFKDVNYTITNDVNNNAVINFIKTPTINDVVTIRTKSATIKNKNGYYEIPASLERNPKNESLKTFTLGEVNDHVSSIVENLDNFNGVFPGVGNLRDISDLSVYGRRFLQHSAPMNLTLYHITNKDSNIVKSLDYSRQEYNKFKRLFMQNAEESEFQGNTKQHVDYILQTLNLNKSKDMPFYFTDMVAIGASIKTEHIILDIKETFFPLSATFSLTTPSKKAVHVYNNGVQLVHGRDYTFNTDGFAIITSTKAQDDVIEIYEYETTNGSYIPATPTKLGLYPAYVPELYTDTTYRVPQQVIQGHDGSRFIAYGDYRDDLLLELERRIYNNIKVSYNTEMLDIHDLVPSEYRKTGVLHSEINKSMLGGFIQWSRLVDQDYTLHNFFERTDRFTFNYNQASTPNNNSLPGFWRQIYKQAFDTDRPHSHPWEMLGLSVMPSWWITQYGPAPYTKDNLLMWTDIQDGILREPNVKYKVLNNYKRPGFINHIPVDESGNLLPPLDAGWITNYQPDTIKSSFVFGDGAPVETAWRNSSDYAFSLIKAFILNKPSVIFATGFDRINQIRNTANEIVYKPTNKRITLSDIIFPSMITDTTQTFTSGLVNYVADYLTSDVLKFYKTYKNDIKTINNQIGFKLAGFTDKDKFKLILDSRTPTNEGNVFIPDENYKIFLNTSSPVVKTDYSGVIIERRTDGYVMKGYSQDSATFKYFVPLKKQSDPSINIGGISESYVVWSPENTYIIGQNVEHQGTFYRTKTQHVSTTTFVDENFAKLPNLPLIGGRDAFLRKEYQTTTVGEINYGHLFTEIQEVIDFLLGYGEYLKSQGFVFDYFEGNEKVVLDWRHSVREFLFWTTQKWAENSVITLSPASSQVKLTSSYSMVDNIFDGFYGYSLYKADGAKLSEDFASLGREPNEFVLRPKNTADGIYHISLPLIQKEHVVLIDNNTVFGDVIFDQQPGYRQERIKVLGYRTSEWDGSLNIPGFIYDDAEVHDWESWTDYDIGVVIKNKEFYYSAPNKVPGTETFNSKDWNILLEKPKGGLYANFEYKTNQFADFYDLDSDNFDVEQQRLAQHLIGYQKRQYLENIVNDDVSQYKFYQGFIQDKGTKNALTKLFDALASDDKDSLDFYEEWAVKDGQYGASEGFDDVIFRLDESKFRLTPQPIELVTSTTGEETDLIYRIKPYEVYQKSKNYDHSPFPEKYVFDSYTRNAGYVNQQDVRGIVTNYNNIIDFNFSDVGEGSYIWVGNEQRDWNVYKHIDTPHVIENISKSTTSATGTELVEVRLRSNPTDITADQIIGISQVYHPDSSKETFEGFFVVDSVVNNIITIQVTTKLTQEIVDIVGNVTTFTSVRAANVVEANSIAQKDLQKDDLLWVDSVTANNEWAVYKNTNHFAEQHRVYNPQSGSDHLYGTELAVDDRNTTLIIGSPDNADGKVFVYHRPSNRLTYTLTQILEPTKYGNDLERFGKAVAISPDAKYLVIGSPNASNIKTKYQGSFINTNDYSKGSIVLKDDQLWKSLVDIEGQEGNIQFNSFSSTTETISSLGLENNNTDAVKVLLVGNYAIDPATSALAFPNIAVNHMLVRAPKDLYEGSGINDQILLNWNSITYTNQDLAPLTVRAPFAGEHAVITDTFLSQEHTIQHKVDTILFVDTASNAVIDGNILQTANASGTVSYVYATGGDLLIYLKNVNGTFNQEDSLFRDDGDFIGQYVKQGPIDTIDTSAVWGGYWWIDTPSYTPSTTTSNTDKATGLVYYDVVTDSTPTGRYYYNSLDYATTDVSSLNVINSEMRTLTYRGTPGAGGSNSTIPSDLYIMRAPKALTDVLSPGNNVSMFVNQLPQYTTGNFKDLTTIGLSTTVTNTTKPIYDIWDGYINLNFTKFDVDGNPFEPRIGDTVVDTNTGATAEVIFYQRNSLAVTVFVKNITGNWSVGDDYGQNAEIKFIGTPADPLVSYQVDRIMGEIQSVSLGYATSGIGKLLVFQAPSNINLNSEDTLIDIEYWFYIQGNVQGIPRPANAPSSINNEWQQVFKIPAESTGTASGLTNEGVYTVYQQAASGRYDPIDTYTVPEKQGNFKLGSSIKITKHNDLYRTMIHAEGEQTQSLPGRIYFLKTGIENNLTYTWEYAKNKKFKGTFSDSINYFTGDIVYRENPAVSGTGVLYIAKTNIASGTFTTTDWTSTDDLVDYIGYIPNTTGTSVVNDSTDGSTVLDSTLLSAFGQEFDTSKNGDVIVASATYDNSKPNQIVVYRLDNGFFYRGQEIQAPDKTSAFGHALAVSDDGMYIAVSAPYNDDYKLYQGKVYIYHQVNGVFTLLQELQSPNNERAERFGWRLQYDGEKLHVTSRNADATDHTTFDTKNTVFDNSFTKIIETRHDTGVVFVYEKTPNGMLYAQSIQITDQDINAFGRNILAKNNHFYVGLPSKVVSAKEGAIVDFVIDDSAKMWTTHRSSNITVDVNKIKKIFLYNIVEGELLTYLDYIDPIQGKVAGPAEQELTYKTYNDPATYSVSTNTSAILDATSSWGPEQVGEVWWNLNNAKFYNPYQGSIEYATQNWNSVFEGNSINVYEWVESDVVPSAWDLQADTEKGFAKGYSGTSIYQDTAYATRRIYNDVSKTFKTMYYFWVQNKTIVPDAEFRSISIQDIVAYITDPAGKGHKFIALIGPSKFVLYNCQSLIRGTDVGLNVQFWTIDNQDQNIHNQYQIISEGLETSQPNTDVVKKWYDSLIGYDAQGRVVPDPTLSEKEKYGALYRPRQGWFKNKSEALKQFIERTNTVLKENIIVGDKDISDLSLSEPAISLTSGMYDVAIDTYADISTVGTSDVKTATLALTIVNGKITQVTVTDAGKGYRVVPNITINGAGLGAILTPTIDGQGRVSNVVITNPGNNYNASTTATVRNFSVFVKADETLTGKWALYERIISASSWNRTRSQSYNVSLYWNYVDWYATDYNESTEIDYLIDYSYQLTSLNNPLGSIVKIANIGTGGWLLLEKTSLIDTEDYTQNYKTIGRQNGTLAFKDTLYNAVAANTGFDTISFDTKIYDSEPTTELRIILEAIRDDILIDELLVEFNKLFFAGLRYVFSEQTYVDWAFKTSFIKAKHNVGQLREDITFNNDNLPSYEAYVKEVKPFSTKIREYLSAYERLEATQTVTTDFDLPASYSAIEGKIIPNNVKVINSVLIGTDADLETYPNKNWLDNSSYSITSVMPVDQGSGYTNPPSLTVTGGGGSGVTLKSYLGSNGNVTKVDIITPGTGFYSAPVIAVNGNLVEGGRHATFSVKLGNNPVRGITTTVRFDRTTGTYVYVKTAQTETFTASGSQFAFNLNWPIDLKITDVTVTKNNLEMLSNEYTYTNKLDATASYERYYGQIEFITKPLKDDIIIVNYNLSPDLYQAQDRIAKLYTPQEGQLGKELSQLMTGIDYGGVEVKSFGFAQGQGWDSDAWFGSTWDSYDNTFNDEIFKLGDSTTLFNFSAPLVTGVEYHVYKNGVRIDDPNFGTGNPVTNVNAVMQSITGAGQTAWSRTDDDYDVSNYVAFNEEVVAFGNTDVVIFRKSTSDGTFLPNEQTYDSIIQGGNLNYSTATGLESADITIDGDGFVTPTTSAGPEEQVPGQLLDTVDIKVFERPSGGGSPITSAVYTGDGATTEYAIETSPITEESLFVKINNAIQTAYTIDYTTNKITFTTAPAIGDTINLVTLGVSGSKVIDIDTITTDGSTVSFLTNVRYAANLQYIITLNGKNIDNVISKSKASDGISGNALIKFATPPAAGQEIRYAFFEGAVDVKNYSQVNIETIVADGSTTAYSLTNTPGAQEPASFKTIVKVGNSVLEAGYSKRYITTITKLEYAIEDFQFPPGTLTRRQLKVYLNGIELTDTQWSLVVGNTSVIRLKTDVQQQNDDILDIFVVTDGEYRFGYIDSASGLWVSTPSMIYLDTVYPENTQITVYQFTNHNSQDIQRIEYDVVDRITLTPGTADYQKYLHLQAGLIALNKEAVDAQYVWVTVNNELLIPSVHYFVTDNRLYVKITKQINQNDTIQVIHFAAPTTQNKLGWSQFKDMLNKTHYKRLSDKENVTLALDLYQYDQSISVINGENLPAPVPGSRSPAVLFIESERIEYFVRNGNVISQFRRGTLGTGVKDVYPADTRVLNSGAENTMPYKDETFTTVFTADGTAATYTLDFTPGNINEFEVFVAGTRLRKNAIQSYKFDNVNGPIAQDSPEGDETLPAEFSINGTELQLLNIPTQNTKVIVVRKQGKIWKDTGVALANSDSDIAKFLRDATVDLPR